MNPDGPQGLRVSCKASLFRAPLWRLTPPAECPTCGMPLRQDTPPARARLARPPPGARKGAGIMIIVIVMIMIVMMVTMIMMIIIMMIMIERAARRRRPWSPQKWKRSPPGQSARPICTCWRRAAQPLPAATQPCLQYKFRFFRENHLSKTMCLTHVFFKCGKS